MLSGYELDCEYVFEGEISSSFEQENYIQDV